MLPTIFRLKINYSQRIFGLDLVRTLAVLLVVLGHSDRLLGQHLTYHPILRFLFAHVFVFFLDGVDLFFVLSGFLIGSILIKIINQEQRFSFRVILHFWQRRWLRTLPNYYLVLGLNLLLWTFLLRQQGQFWSWTLISQLTLPKYFFFLQNFNQPCPPFFVESWSLAIEEWFYLLLPIVLSLVFLGIRFIFKTQKSVAILSFQEKKWGIFISLSLFLLVATILRITKVLDVNMPINAFDAGNLYRTTVLPRLDSLMFGVLGGFVKYYHANFWIKTRYWALVLGVFLIYILHFWASQTAVLLSGHALVWLTLRLSIQGFAILCFMPWADQFGQTKPNIFRATITYISLASYSIYLFNLLIIKALTIFVLPNLPSVFSVEATVYSFFWIILIGLSILVYKYFEKPIMDLRKA